MFFENLIFSLKYKKGGIMDSKQSSEAEKKLPTIQEIREKLGKFKNPPTREEKIQEIKSVIDGIDRRCVKLSEKERVLKMNYNVPILLDEIRELGTRFILARKEGGEYTALIFGSNNYGLAELIYTRLEMKEPCPKCKGMPLFNKRKKYYTVCPCCIGTGTNDRLNPSCDFGLPLIYKNENFRLIYPWKNFLI